MMTSLQKYQFISITFLFLATTTLEQEAPTNLTCKSNGKVISVFWNRNSTIIYYVFASSIAAADKCVERTISDSLPVRLNRKKNNATFRASKKYRISLCTSINGKPIESIICKTGSTPVTNLTARTISSTTIQLDWSRPHSANKSENDYIIKRLPGNISSLVNENSSEINDLISNTNYNFFVALQSSENVIGTFQNVSVTTNFSQPMIIRDSASSASSINITWIPPEVGGRAKAIRNYLVERTPGEVTIRVNGTKTTLTNLTSNTTYSISVRAQADDDSLGDTDSVSITTKSETISTTSATSSLTTFESTTSLTETNLLPKATPNATAIIFEENIYTTFTEILANEFLTSHETTISSSYSDPAVTIKPSVNKEFCNQTTMLHPVTETLITFPKTRSGYKNISVEVCPSYTQNSGTPLATRICSEKSIWDYPVFLSSCNISFDALSNATFNTQAEAEGAATQLSVLTSNFSSITTRSALLVTSTLRKIVSFSSIPKSTSISVMETASNLLQAPSIQSNSSELKESIRQTLNDVGRKSSLNEGEDFKVTTSQVSLAATKRNKTENRANGISFIEKKPTAENLGFSSEQFQLVDQEDDKQINDSSISIPNEVLQRSKDGRVTFFAFANDNLFQVAPTNERILRSNDGIIPPTAKIQSRRIISASVDGNTQNLSQNVKIIFRYNQASCHGDIQNEDCGEYMCGYWDEKLSLWSRQGCSLINMTDEIIECQCNHLTNFATLFASGNSSTIRNQETLDVLTYVCCSFSLVGSLMTIISIIFVRCNPNPAINNRTAIVMINLAVALTLLNSFLLLSFVAEVTDDEMFCTAIAILLHFSLLSTLMWCLVEALYILLGFVKPLYYKTGLSSKKLFLFTFFVGWGLPATFVGVFAGVSLSFYRSKTSVSSFRCWIDFDMVIFMVTVPCSIILCAILVVYFILLGHYFTKKDVGECKQRPNISSRKSLIFSFSLFLLLGITWIFGLLVHNSSTASIVFAYIFTLTSGFQGVLLFLLFIVRNKKFRLAVKFKTQKIQKFINDDSATFSSSEKSKSTKSIQLKSFQSPATTD